MKNEVKEKMHVGNERCCTKVTARRGVKKKISPYSVKIRRARAFAHAEEAAVIGPRMCAIAQ
jgi:hypothetical protein